MLIPTKVTARMTREISALGRPEMSKKSLLFFWSERTKSNAMMRIVDNDKSGQHDFPCEADQSLHRGNLILNDLMPVSETRVQTVINSNQPTKFYEDLFGA